MLHLDRIKEDCRESVTRNVSLWVAPSTNGIPGPPAQIVDALCINDCSAHGHCSAGIVKLGLWRQTKKNVLHIIDIKL